MFYFMINVCCLLINLINSGLNYISTFATQKHFETEMPNVFNTIIERLWTIIFFTSQTGFLPLKPSSKIGNNNNNNISERSICFRCSRYYSSGCLTEQLQKLWRKSRKKPSLKQSPQWLIPLFLLIYISFLLSIRELSVKSVKVYSRLKNKWRNCYDTTLLKVSFSTSGGNSYV